MCFELLLLSCVVCVFVFKSSVFSFVELCFVVHFVVCCCFDMFEKCVFVWFVCVCVCVVLVLLYDVGKFVLILLKSLFLCGCVLYVHKLCVVCCLVVLSLVNICCCSAADMERVPESDITNEIVKTLFCFVASASNIVLVRLIL